MKLHALLAAALTAATPLCAAYTHILATEDGHAIYFSVGGIAAAAPGYVARVSPGGLRVETLERSFVDASASGSVLAFSNFADGRTCGFAGSTCFVAPNCSAYFEIDAQQPLMSGYGWRTAVRLDASGRIAWISQDRSCPGMAMPAPTPLNGLYDLQTKRQIAAAKGSVLASQRTGRRLITTGGRALTFAGPQLQWLDANGAQQIRHVYGAAEAVTDATGDNIVYADTTPQSGLHWITGGNDDNLGINGFAPALTADGRALVFIGEDGLLRRYDPSSRTVRPLSSAAVSEFVIGGAYVIAATAQGRLVRIALDSGESTTLLEAVPDIRSAAVPTAPVQVVCPLICYGELPRWLAVTRGMVVVLNGINMDAPGWSVAGENGDSAPLKVLSAEAAWFQVTDKIGALNSPRTIRITNPNHPVALAFTVFVEDQAAACLGTLHQDFSRGVTADDPASAGEIVHVFLTGLRGRERVGDGIPNPVDRLIPVADGPALADPGFADTLFFGLAPGLIGIQQLDLRVIRPAASNLIFEAIPQSACTPPPMQ